MSILDKLVKNSTIKMTAPILDSTVYGKKEVIKTSIPMINVALSGDLNGGLLPGLFQIAGPSKHFKTAFALLIASSYLKKYEDGVILFYDSEFGTPKSYLESFGIDMNRVVHSPITDVEQLKFDVTKQLNELEKGDHVCIIIDSIGNLASKKEVDDALDGKSVADMSRAKQIKSLFRIVTPHLNLKDIPMIAVNHTYKEMSLFPKDIVSGGTGGYYSADEIWIVGRQQDKEKSELQGYNFIINIEKSRHVREKSKISVNVTFEGGINKWSGLFDVALDGGYLVKPKNGWYDVVDPSTGELLFDKAFREKELDGTIWNKLIKETSFPDYINKKFKLSNHNIMNEEEENV
jgi:RecA/RadA recombinase